MKVSSENIWTEQDGSILVVALLILVFLTLIGISANTTTEIEIQVAGNEQAHKTAFYHADAGVYMTPKIIRSCVEQGLQPSYSTITYLDTQPPDAFFRQIMGFDSYDSDKDIQFTLGGYTVQVDTQRNRQESIAGGGAEFASGAEGAGSGMTGGVAVIYALDSVGTGPRSSQSEVLAEYRLVPGIAGGL